MNRRDSIRRLTLASAGLMALPAWTQNWTLSEVSTGGVFTDEETLTSIVDTIIPNNGAIGGISVGVDKFLVKLIRDCYDADANANVVTQLQKLNDWAQTTFAKSFPLCEQKQREELLLKLEASKEKSETDFFRLVKSETIRGFNTSREVLVNYHKFQMVPGHYHGCVNVNS